MILPSSVSLFPLKPLQKRCLPLPLPFSEPLSLCVEIKIVEG
jgi:hypothetical protein